MHLDLKLTQLALKWKQLVLMDVSFPQPAFPEFKSAYDLRFVHLPGQGGLAAAMAAGLAASGHLVLLYGLEGLPELHEPTLNVKLLVEDSQATWAQFEEKLREFGPGVVLVPEG